jgi:hypothetical protein
MDSYYTITQNNTLDNCFICLDIIKDLTMLPCGHYTCLEHIKHLKECPNPYCKYKIKDVYFFDTPVTKKIDEQRGYKVFCKKCNLSVETSILEHNKKHVIITKEEFEEIY